MRHSMRIFGLLLYKNLLIRKRHWLLTLICHILIPIGTFALIQAGRDYSVNQPITYNHSTFYPIHTEKVLLDHINIDNTRLYFLPRNTQTQKIMRDTQKCLRLPAEHVIGFETEAEMEVKYTVQQAEKVGRIFLAVVFEEYEGNKTKNIKYKIKHSSTIPHKLFVDPLDELAGFQLNPYFEKIPLLQLQMCLDTSLIQYAAPEFSKPELSVQQMPYPPHVKIDILDATLRELVSAFGVVILLIPLCSEINYSAKEKFIGINFLMPMNGVKLYQNLASWLASGVIFSNLYIIPVIILFKHSFTSNVNPYFDAGNVFILWLFFVIHITHLISFGMHVAAYFSKQLFMIIILAVVYMISISVQSNMIEKGYYTWIPYLGIIFPNMLFVRFFQELNIYEGKLIGIHWNNLFVISDPSYGRAGSAGSMLIFSILGIILHFTLTIYVNAVRPGKYGVKEHPLYFLKLMKKNKISLNEEVEDVEKDEIDNYEDFEEISNGVLSPGIQIRKLKKTYSTNFLGSTKVHALKGISINFYKGEITALLGHNGAGKTTLMSIMTGVTCPTSGTVHINGKRHTDVDLIKRDLGLCPQENIYFPDLSVFEQMKFFGLLKRNNENREFINEEITSLLKKLRINEKKNVLPDQLSGGQKRKLCLGMALIGNASTLILDEPTSGMDPETRRDTWDLIMKMRGKKTVLISTHNMEEADIIGDRIAIIHAGRLKSYGTPMYLKKQQGHGHIQVTLSTETWRDLLKIKSLFPVGTHELSINDDKIFLSVPYTDSLPESLDTLEQQKKQLGITGMSTSLITLEEVFLNIIKKDENETDSNELIVTPMNKLEGFPLWRQRVQALFAKKFAYTKKNLLILSAIFILPLVPEFVMSLSSLNSSDSLDVLSLKLNMYRSPESLYSSDADENYGEKYKKTVESYGGSLTTPQQNVSVSLGLLNVSLFHLPKYRNNFIISAEFNKSDGKLLANGFYSEFAEHGLPLTMNMISNTFLKTLAGDDYSIDLSIQELPHTISSTLGRSTETAVIRVLLFCIFFFPLAALFITHPMHEKVTTMKQLQRMTGVDTFTYWGSMFVFDLYVFTASVCFICLGFYIWDVILEVDMFKTLELFIVGIILILFGINALLIAYIFSFMSRIKNTMVILLSIAPFGLVIMHNLVEMITAAIAKLKVLHSIQSVVFRLIPHITFFHAQVEFYDTALKNARCRRIPNELQNILPLILDPCATQKCWNGTCKNQAPYFGNEDGKLTENILYLSLTPLLYLLLLICLEENIFLRLGLKLFKSRSESNNITMDEMVKKEKDLILQEIRKIPGPNGYSNGRRNESSVSLQITENNSIFMVYELSKYYGKLMAVKEIDFRVKQGECFGLLGVNGAGKSTTFKMLTGEEIPSNGAMYLNGLKIDSNCKQYLSQIGYCPQIDALIDALNAFEHLTLFARLRGIPEWKIPSEVDKWIDRLNLHACKGQPSRTYSGGNKRRLNIAMALIGHPPLILLDEPTTGVDPAARRSLWKVIQACQDFGQAVIFTSHSMEECEALCNRLVIMVRGELVCVGASQELKQRFGAGYDIFIKLNPARTEPDVNDIKRNLEVILIGEITDENMGSITYHVKDSQVSWKKMYSTMNELKERYRCIEDFSIVSATLEQLFIQFARGTEKLNRDSFPKQATPV